MKTGKLILAGVVALVVMFVLGLLWHVVILKGFYASPERFPVAADESQKVGFIILGYLVLAILMVIAYPIGYKGGAPWLEGLRFGILIGLIWSLAPNLVYVGVWKVSFGGAIVDAIWHVVEQGVGGLVLGILAGRTEAGSASSEGSAG